MSAGQHGFVEAGTDLHPDRKSYILYPETVTFPTNHHHLITEQGSTLPDKALAVSIKITPGLIKVWNVDRLSCTFSPELCKGAKHAQDENPGKSAGNHAKIVELWRLAVSRIPVETQFRPEKRRERIMHFFLRIRFPLAWRTQLLFALSAGGGIYISVILFFLYSRWKSVENMCVGLEWNYNILTDKLCDCGFIQFSVKFETHMLHIKSHEIYKTVKTTSLVGSFVIRGEGATMVMLAKLLLWECWDSLWIKIYI